MARHGRTHDESRRAAQRLAGVLLDDVERITRRSVSRMREQLPSYAKVPVEALYPVTLNNTRNLLAAICDPAIDPGASDDQFRVSGETRLNQGITADEMLQAWRIGLEVVREEARPIAEQLEMTDAALLEFVDASLRWGDIGMRMSAVAHREGEIRELERLAAEQSALRRVATLAARHAPPDEVFSLVTEEVSRLIEASSVRAIRYESDGSATILAAWGIAVNRPRRDVNVTPPGGTVAYEVLHTGAPARIDSFQQIGGAVGALMREEGARCAAGGPILIDGRPWGAIVVGAREPLPSGTEERIARFAELVSAAVSNVESRAAVQRLAAEQSALARVATLVAREHSPDDLFSILTAELGLLLEVDASAILRYGADATATVVAGWTSGGTSLPLGERLPLEGVNLASEVHRTGASHRREQYGEAPGPIAGTVRKLGFRSAVASPIVVAGAIWGVIAVLSRRPEPLPADTEVRLEQFTRHAGMAVANAKSRAELAQSRARVVRAGDEARRRLERDLHDGAQQRLVSLGLQLRAVERSVAPELDELRESLERVSSGVNEVLDDLRELSRGLHPSVLADGGLTVALRALARRSAVPVRMRLDIGCERFEDPIEVTVYFVAAEALTNVAKHAHAARVDLSATRRDDWFELVIRDDGLGGADPSSGTGLAGLVDRVEAIGGTSEIDSRRDVGTLVQVRLPIGATRS